MSGAPPDLGAVRGAAEERRDEAEVKQGFEHGGEADGGEHGGDDAAAGGGAEADQQAAGDQAEAAAVAAGEDQADEEVQTEVARCAVPGPLQRGRAPACLARVTKRPVGRVETRVVARGRTHVLMVARRRSTKAQEDPVLAQERIKIGGASHFLSDC